MLINHGNLAVSADAASCAFSFGNGVIMLRPIPEYGHPPQDKSSQLPALTLYINRLLFNHDNTCLKKLLIAWEKRVTPFCQLVRLTPWERRWAWTGLGNCTSRKKKFYLYRIQNEDLYTENLFTPGLRQEKVIRNTVLVENLIILDPKFRNSLSELSVEVLFMPDPNINHLSPELFVEIYSYRIWIIHWGFVYAGSKIVRKGPSEWLSIDFMGIKSMDPNIEWMGKDGPLVIKAKIWSNIIWKRI